MLCFTHVTTYLGDLSSDSPQNTFSFQLHSIPQSLFDQWLVCGHVGLSARCCSHNAAGYLHHLDLGCPSFVYVQVQWQDKFSGVASLGPRLTAFLNTIFILFRQPPGILGKFYFRNQHPRGYQWQVAYLSQSEYLPFLPRFQWK